jgi:hypothetical protein
LKTPRRRENRSILDPFADPRNGRMALEFTPNAAYALGTSSDDVETAPTAEVRRVDDSIRAARFGALGACTYPAVLYAHHIHDAHALRSHQAPSQAFTAAVVAELKSNQRRG